jgi:4-hydroxy-3-polyprenylbenzoate decarboxylase
MGLFVLGMTGATGAPYAIRTLEGLIQNGHDVSAVISEAGRRVLEIEMGTTLNGIPEADAADLLSLANVEGPGQLTVFTINDYSASIASGSFKTDGMVVVPCSMGSLARIANGVSSNLLERAADVTLKERRKLILIPREMPLGLIHLRNMVALTEAGAEIVPPSPGFYHRPESMQDLIDSVAGRILDRLGVEASFLKRWTGAEEME